MDLLKYNISNKVFAFSTRRKGGYSSNNYSSFNATDYCGDTLENVNKNKYLLASYLNISIDRLIIPHQTHNTNILNIDETFIKASDNERKLLLYDKDALITSMPGYCLCVSTADCVPVIIYDQVHHVAACIHSGWRGTVNNICKKTIISMSSIYNTNPFDCIAILGPGISKKNFEVGDEVYNIFYDNGFDMDIVSYRNNKWHIDLFKCIYNQLTNIGFKGNNIHNIGICTYDNSSVFFSARKMGINSGRILTGILLKSQL